MKLFLLIFFILYTTFLAQGQENSYIPFVEEGKIWTFETDGPLKDLRYRYSYELKGDTIIAGRKCKKMYSDNKYNLHNTCYEGAFYEEDKAIYTFFVGNEDPVLLYDFALEVGDTIVSVHSTFIATKKYTQMYNERIIRTTMLRRHYDDVEIYDDFDNKWNTVYWLEGIGCPQDYFYEPPHTGAYCYLISCEVKDCVYYRTSLNTIREITPLYASKLSLYDLSGRLLSAPPAKGLFIQDGQKVVR